MRDLLLARIAAIITHGSGGLQTAFELPKRRDPEKSKAEIIARGQFYPGFDFSTLSDADLVRAFEKIVRCYYKPWA